MDITKLRNKKLDRILWLDLEMTGLSPTDDLILEVAVIVTDWKFKEIASYEGVVKHKVDLIEAGMARNSKFWDANQTSKAGLLEQNESGKTLTTIQNELVKFVDKNFKKGLPVLLAGNSIHMDRQFITKQLPKFNDRLHYRMLDVSAWKVVFSNKYKKVRPSSDTHRALDDIRGSIAELQYYLSFIK